MVDNRKFWQKKTNWGIALAFVAGGLQAIDLGAIAEIIRQVADVCDIPMIVYGALDRVTKKR